MTSKPRRVAVNDKTQPDWVPDVAWTGYQNVAAYASARTDLPELMRQEADLFKKIVLDERCKGLWPIIYSATSVPDDISHSYRVAQIPRHLLLVILKAIDGPASANKVSKGNRRDRWESIAKHANALRQALQNADRNNEIPAQITSALTDRLHSAYQTYTSVDLAMPSSLIKSQDNLDLAKARLMVRDLFMNGRIDILASLSDSANAWTGTSPSKKTKSGDRTIPHMILMLTNYFMKLTGQPYRDQVAALTNCVLDIPDSERLDGDDVTRVAPVQTETAPKRKSHPKLISAASKKTSDKRQ